MYRGTFQGKTANIEHTGKTDLMTLEEWFTVKLDQPRSDGRQVFERVLLEKLSFETTGRANIDAQCPNPACAHQGRWFDPGQKLYGCTECPYTSASRNW